MDPRLDRLLLDLPNRIQVAIEHFWEARTVAIERQRSAGKADAGFRGAVTGGAQMNAFVEILVDVMLLSGLRRSDVFHRKSIELPGYFRPTKEWDLVVVSNGCLLVAVEVKSQVGPSFGNNFNNRTEEAMGSALDLWTAYREGRFNGGVQPWLGYLFLLEDCPRSRSPVEVREPHFSVFPEFKGASYATRYELFCRKLRFERHYTSTALILTHGETRRYSEPAADLTMDGLVRSLVGHLLGAV